MYHLQFRFQAASLETSEYAFVNEFKNGYQTNVHLINDKNGSHSVKLSTLKSTSPNLPRMGSVLHDQNEPGFLASLERGFAPERGPRALSAAALLLWRTILSLHSGFHRLLSPLPPLLEGLCRRWHEFHCV